MARPTLVFARHLWGDREGFIETRAMRGGIVQVRDWLKWPSEEDEYGDTVEYELSDMDVFSGVLLRKHNGAGTAQDCEPLVHVLWADLDEKQGATFGAVLGTLLPSPTMVVDSGHGWHLYWKLAKPVTHAMAEALNRSIAIEFAGDTVGDVARIMRVPGSYNHKDIVTPVRIINESQTTVRPTDIDPVWEMPSIRRGGTPTGSKGTRSEAIFKQVIQWIKDGYSDEDILEKLLTEPIGEKVQEMKSGKRQVDWVELTIRKAREAANV